MAMTTKLTYDDLARFPDDGKRYELVDGEVHVSPAPLDPHQSVSGNLFLALSVHVRERQLGRVRAAPYDIILNPHTTFEPDIFFVREARWAGLMRDGRVYGPPDLCIEIASPSTRHYDRTTKYAQYAHFGVWEYWIVDPALRTVETFTREQGVYRALGVFNEDASVVSRVLPELVLPVAAVFADT